MYAVSSLLVGVDRRRGARRAHHGEVGQDPLVARRRRDPDPLLGLDAEGAGRRRASTRSPAWRQVTDSHPSPRGSGTPPEVAGRGDAVENCTAKFWVRSSTKPGSTPGLAWAVISLLLDTKTDEGCDVT